MIRERCRAVISDQAACYNFKCFKKYISRQCKLMCVVKADAYGHGAAHLASLWETCGADMFAVATYEEALSLHAEHIHTPCLILGYMPPQNTAFLCRHNILPTIFSYEEASAWETKAEKEGVILPCHIKINTGMNRIGIPYNDNESIKKICMLPHLHPMGIYSHLSAADTDMPLSELQFERFTHVCQLTEHLLRRRLIKHIVATEGILRYPHMHLDMVRAGIGLYGYTSQPTLPVQPVMRLEARVIQLHTVPAGENIGYGNFYKTKKVTRVAVISIGYADGIRRDSGNVNRCVTIRESHCPIIGNVCMDMCMADVSSLIKITVGDTAIFFGDIPSHGADSVAAQYGTIPYEILTSVSKRVKRIYE